MNKFIVLVLMLLAIPAYADFDFTQCNQANYERALKISREYLPGVPDEWRIYDQSSNISGDVTGISIANSTIAFSATGNMISSTGYNIVPWIENTEREVYSQYEIEQRIKELDQEVGINSEKIIRLKAQLQERKTKDAELTWAKKLIHWCLIADREEPCTCNKCCKHKERGKSNGSCSSARR